MAAAKALAAGERFAVPARAAAALDSAVWARDFNEVKALGARKGSSRTAEQTEIARFWEATKPSIYHGVVRAVADRPGREITRNARLLAAVAQGMDDALIAVFDAKYHYNFWRPITAIRNGDKDGNEATARDAAWMPFIETPMHPEYPCAHCILAATVGTVIEAEAGGDPLPELSTTATCSRASRAAGHRPRTSSRKCQRAHLRRRALPQLHGSRGGDGPEGRRGGSKRILRGTGKMTLRWQHRNREHAIRTGLVADA